MTSSRENIELLKRLWIFPACLLAIASEYVYRGGELILSIFSFYFFTTAPRKVAIFIITYTRNEYILIREGYFSLTISRRYKRGPRRNAKMSKISASRPNTSRETMKYETRCLVEKTVKKKTMRSRYIMR